jgi:hypothetical protein
MNNRTILLRSVIYGFIGLVAFIQQPNWVYQNFWSRADFWDQWGFRIPYLLFCAIYAAIAIAFTHSLVKFVKRYL